jgi:hypothetical protein
VCGKWQQASSWARCGRAECGYSEGSCVWCKGYRVGATMQACSPSHVCAHLPRDTSAEEGHCEHKSAEQPLTPVSTC